MAVTTYPSAHCIFLAVTAAVIGRPKKSMGEVKKREGCPCSLGFHNGVPSACYLELKAPNFLLCLSPGLAHHGALPLQWPESRESWGSVPGSSWQRIQQGSWLQREQYSPCRHSGAT